MSRFAKNIILQLLRGYKLAVSPWVGSACRFVPTCSEYAMEAVDVHGVVRGAFMAIARVARCHPFSASGYDPVARNLTASREHFIIDEN
jgi:putative membrane protein insertion efficiency factor